MKKKYEALFAKFLTDTGVINIGFGPETTGERTADTGAETPPNPEENTMQFVTELKGLYTRQKKISGALIAVLTTLFLAGIAISIYHWSSIGTVTLSTSISFATLIGAVRVLNEVARTSTMVSIVVRIAEAAEAREALSSIFAIYSEFFGKR